MKKLLTIPIIILSIACNAQTLSFKFGTVDKSELTLKEYEEDKNAEAVIFYDNGRSYFTPSNITLELFFERSFRIKIFKKSGYKWGEIQIPYYDDGETKEKVLEVEAFSYNLEDSIIKRDALDPKNIFDERKNEYWRNKRFALPNVKEGTVIEVRYKISSPRIFDFRDWEFQNRIPTFYSQYIVKMVPFYEYSFVLQGKKEFDVSEAYNESMEELFAGVTYSNKIYKFGMQYIPAFNDETYITSYNDYVLKLDFQLAKIKYPNGSNKDIISTWPSLKTTLLNDADFGKYCNSAKKTGDEILNLPELVLKPPKERFETIINFVKKDYNWDGWYGIDVRKPLKEFLNQKTGNIANINLFLAGLLNAAGLETYPVILSTREHGKIKVDYPFVHFFNYVVVAVVIDGKFVLADASEPMCPNSHIPPRCMNEKGLIINKKEVQWIDLTSSEPSYIKQVFSISFTSNRNDIDYDIKASYSLNEAYSFREKYGNNIEKIRQSLHEKNYLSIDSLTVKNYIDPSKNYIITYHAKYPKENIDKKIYISPFLYESITQNPLKQSTRNYPVDFTYPFGEKYESTINIPEGYLVEFIPQSLQINNDNINIDYQAIQTDKNRILVKGTFTFKKSVYSPDNYLEIKNYFNEIVKKFNEKIVLVKE